MKWYDKQKKLFQEREEGSSTLENDKVSGIEVVDETINADLIEGEEKQMNYFDDETQINDYNENTTQSNYKNTPETNISKDTFIQGNLKMDGNLVLSGKIIGDVECSGDIHVNGEIEGNITCQNAYFDAAVINGNINCSTLLEINDGTKVTGDIVTKEMTSNGHVVGNVVVDGDLALSSESIIEGNVQAQYLESEKGASLKGQITITA